MSVSSPKKRRGVAPRLSEECVTGGITDRMSLRLDDAPAEPAVIDIMDDYFAKQVARQMHAIESSRLCISFLCAPLRSAGSA